jgi:hypothetical protein
MTKRTNGGTTGGNRTNGSSPQRPAPRTPRQPAQRPGAMQKSGATIQVASRGTARHVPPGPPQRPPLPDPVEGVFDDAAMGMGMGLGPSEEDRIAAWLEDLYAVGPVASLSLQQVVGGGGTCPVRDWLDQELADMGDAQGIAGEIFATASEDCASSGQFSRYVITATTSTTNRFRRLFFTIQAPPIDQAGFQSEFGGEGLVSQAHRHVEAIMRIGLGSAAASLRSVIMQNHELSGLARSAWVAQAEAASAREKLLDRELERSLLMRKQSATQDRHERTMKWVEALVATIGIPTLLHKMGAPPSVVAQAAAVGQAMQGVSLGAAPPPQPASAAPAAAAAAGPQAPAPISISSADDLALVRQVVVAMVPLLAATPDAALGLLLARLAPDEQEIVRAVRDRAVAGGDGRPAIEADKPLMGSFADVVCHLVGAALGDVEVGMLVGQLPDDARTAVLRLRALLNTKAAASGALGSKGADADRMA